ncbi:uncharacterized protein LOC141529366 [Cotesia typhae]|uniref:uncharacterized protein LOC141529366 n=1 Tax=Cotesia typhae TaxID=2053667 RepID=UPI003D688F01
MNFFIVIFCVIAGAYGEGQSPSTRNYSCPGVPPMPNMEVPMLNGTFYGCEESATNFPDLSCTSLVLVPNGPNGWSSIFSGFSKKTGYLESYTAACTVNEEKHIKVTYNSLVETTFILNLWILYTDYKSVVYWSCDPNDPESIPKLWMLAKDHSQCSNYKERFETLKQQLGLNITTKPVNQNNCY